MRDLVHNETYEIAIAPAVATDNTAIVGNWINVAGYDALSFSIFTGAITGTPTFTVLVEDADAADQSDHAAVASNYLLSRVPGVDAETAAGNDLAGANTATKIGYIGSKQYVRITVTPASNTSAALAAVAKLGNPSVRPAP